MSDERMQPLLDAWFRDRDEPAREASYDIARVMADVPRTRQQGRWWPLPVLPRKSKAKAPTTNDMTVYQPSPIPATNGHAPTVIGRTQTMFSPVKAITAGALVFALGGAFLIAQPIAQPEVGAPGAEMTELPGFTVTVRQECVYADCTWTASDPRLTGTLAHEWLGGVEVEAAAAEGLGAGLNSAEVTFEGPEGSWTGHVYVLWGEPNVSFLVLSGAGANEGWRYVASNVDSTEAHGDLDWTGTLYEGELPPYGPLTTPTGD